LDRPSNGLRKSVKVRKGLLVVVVAAAAVGAAYTYWRQKSVELANICRITTPKGVVTVNQYKGLDASRELAEITLEDFNAMISEMNAEQLKGRFNPRFLREARQKIADMGFEMAEPGTRAKPDPQKALAILVTLVEGEFFFLEDKKLDADADGKYEYGSHQQLKSGGESYLPGEIAEIAEYRGYTFTIILGKTVDEREAGFVIHADPTAGVGPHYRADQTGSIRVREGGQPGPEDKEIKKVEWL